MLWFLLINTLTKGSNKNLPQTIGEEMTILYHYTRQDCLPKILESQRLELEGYNIEQFIKSNKLNAVTNRKIQVIVKNTPKTLFKKISKPYPLILVIISSSTT